MAQYLRFILDSDNDDHYTDSLITLSSIPYIWYRLRRDGLARSILFLRVREDNQLEFHVCDDKSREHLLSNVRRTSWFDRPSQSDTAWDYSLKALNLAEEDLLHRLLCVDGEAALVFSFDAFARVCRSDRKSGKNKLTALLQGRIPNYPIFIRLPLRAEELAKCVHADTSDCPALHEALSRLHGVSGLRPEPMLKVLSGRVGDQLMRLDSSPDEMFHLLLQLAARDPEAPDSLEELKDQADYLELCRTLRIRLLEPQYDAERYTPVSRRDTAARLRDPAFHSRLREEVRDLRTRCPFGDIRTALKQVTHLPELPPLPICNDELTHAALSLSIPDQCRYKAEWSQKLDQAKRCLIQLWNKPRNPEVVTAAMELCNSAYSAISSESWNTLNEILPLLSFFSQQLCAPRERNEALDKLLGYGRMMITLCEDLQSRGTFSAPEGFDELAFMGIDEGDKKSLELLRTLVRNGIRNFNRQDLSMPALIHCMEEDFAIYQKEIKQSQEFNRNLRDRIHRHQEQPLYSPLNDDDPDGEDLSGLSISPDPIRPDNPPPTGGSAIHIEYPEPESPVEPADPPRQNRDCDAAIDPDDYLDQHFFHKQTFYEERPADDLFG